jgi:hypothetical protein
MTGLDSEVAPFLWFHAIGGEDSRRGFTVAGVFEAAGIADAAQVHVTRRRVCRQVQLRMAVDPQMWGLAAALEREEGNAPALVSALTITARGVPRPLEFAAIGRWL